MSAESGPFSRWILGVILRCSRMTRARQCPSLFPSVGTIARLATWALVSALVPAQLELLTLVNRSASATRVQPHRLILLPSSKSGYWHLTPKSVAGSLCSQGNNFPEPRHSAEFGELLRHLCELLPYTEVCSYFSQITFVDCFHNL